jgi:hypothetical protein
MATAFVNKHITRVLAAGGGSIDASWVATADAFLTNNSLHPYLVAGVDPGFGVDKTGSNMNKAFCLGTTRLPRLGDLTFENPAGSTYSATGMGSNGVPAWVNASGTDRAYFGSARAGTMRYNNIRKRHTQGLTLIGVFKRPSAATTSLLGYFQFGGFYLQNTAGGACKGFIGGTSNAWTAPDTHPTALAENATHILGFTWDQATKTAISYVEGVASSGTVQSSATNDPLLGGINTNTDNPFICHGSQECTVSRTNFSVATTRSYSQAQAIGTFSGLWIFDTALTPTQMAAFNTMQRTRIGT